MPLSIYYALSICQVVVVIDRVRGAMYSKSMARKQKNPAAVSLGSLGGKARAKRLSPERRREIARKAIQIRWARRKPARKDSSHP